MPKPAPKAGEVLLEVRAVSVNFVDLVMMSGSYQFKPPLPFIPGKLPVGVVAAVGDGVTKFKPGDHALLMAESAGLVAKNRRTKATKPAATRDQVYAFANTAIQSGYPEAAAAAIICFEWLQRPENVLSGYIRWTDYRGREAPTAIRVFHHKTGAVVLHPLQDVDGTLFYADAEDVLARLPRRGIPMILHEMRGKT